MVKGFGDAEVRTVEVAACESQLGVDWRWGPAPAVDWRSAAEVLTGEMGDKGDSDPRLSLWRRRRLMGVTGSWAGWACEVDAKGGGLSAILRFFPLVWLGVRRAMTVASDLLTTRHIICMDSLGYA
jgi:hypothetical protein